MKRLEWRPPPTAPQSHQEQKCFKELVWKSCCSCSGSLKRREGKIWVRIFKQALFNTTLGFHNELRPGWSSCGQESPKGDGKTATGRRLLRFQADGAIYAIIPTCKKGLVKVMERKKELLQSWSGQRVCRFRSAAELSWTKVKEHRSTPN